jgi:CRP-like cAMP-binding protein
MSANPDIVRALKAAGLFKNFTDTGIQIIASIAQQKRVPPNTPLFVENMIGEGLYVIADGMIRLAVRAPDGRETTLAMLNPGDSLGEAAILRAGPRLCSATAEVETTVIEISRRDIALLQRSKPQACLKLMMGIVELIGERIAQADPDFRQFLAYRLSV